MTEVLSMDLNADHDDYDKDYHCEYHSLAYVS